MNMRCYHGIAPRDDVSLVGIRLVEDRVIGKTRSQFTCRQACEAQKGHPHVLVTLQCQRQDIFGIVIDS